MSDAKVQVKVDNWGIYFLQRLKHFFNRTDFCDLTLQFQDNAQLKVHRLVLNACTEYFELLERTCEMYEDCLVMPDDLQADVVVPIVNFMYTGHLEFRIDLLERLYQTSQILNMPVLSKLLESHRVAKKNPTHSYSSVKRFTKTSEPSKVIKPNTSNKRSYSKAFNNNSVVYREKKVYQPLKSSDSTGNSYCPTSPIQVESVMNKKHVLTDPRPTRYELPEELDGDNVFDNSFCNISYTCKPLMIHPETVKRYSSKRGGLFSEASSSKKLLPGTSTVDIVECKRISKDDNIFDDSIPDHSLADDLDLFHSSYSNEPKDSSQLFDQILDDGPKVTIEAKDSKSASNLDHAKIISEVLKKYPHLVKSNKNIKLKILNTPSKAKKQIKTQPTYVEKKLPKLKMDEPDYTYETDVLDSQQAAKLIAMGAENTKGPWICLICGTPGKALHFTSYFKFRRHLVDVHNEKPVSNICEYCGLKSLKRNYLLHHLYSQHNVPPPPQYHFPKCNRCNYIALTEGLLVKHKVTHKEPKNFRCNVCAAPFDTTKELLQHIQTTGHKYSAEKKTNLQCIYCLKTFLRHGNLYAHLKTYHRKEAKNDGIIEDSDDEKAEEIPRLKIENREGTYQHIKFEPSTSYDIYNENIYEDVDVQYQIQERPDGDIQLTPRKQHNVISNQQHNVISNQQQQPTTPKQKILNPGFGTPKPTQKPKPIRKPQPEHSTFLEDMNIPSPPTHNEEEIVLIDNNEYIMRDNQLIPRKAKPGSNEYIISDMMEPASLEAIQPTTSMAYTNVHTPNIVQEAQPTMVVKKTTNINQPIQIVVSNEEEYKALMASNHPLLFGNGDPNKTLTVLTAQHNPTMESATIDLDNTQPNDMMIIQQDFPLNVTEAVSTNNSNIVVVYSHPVDDPNKQYQILTTGGIGSQFVQSSAIITQNYETVTTSTPVMSAHVLEPQPDTTWQDNVQSESTEHLHIEPQPDLQNVVIENVEKPFEEDPNNDLSELPEVQLVSEGQEMIPQETLTNDSSSECIVSQDAEQDMSEENQNIPETEMETDTTVLREAIEQETPITEPMDITHDTENIPNLSNIANPEGVIHEPMETESIEQTVAQATEIIPLEEQVANTINVTEISEIVGNDNSNTLEDHQPIPNSIQDQQALCIAVEEQEVLPTTVEESQALPINIDEQQPLPMSLEQSQTLPIIIEKQQALANLVEEPALPESQAYDDIVEINHISKADEQTCPKEAEEKIQNLTSEWSEDEYDVIEDTPAPIETASKANDIITPAEPELEETIENIQQEVLNHVASTNALTATVEPTPDVETEESQNSTLEDTIPSPEEPALLPTTETIVPASNDPQTQQKISSLLNDWEDNDSQEDVTNNSIEPDEVATSKEVSDVTIEKVPKADNIKSLVSDWDDDEEEVKEQ